MELYTFTPFIFHKQAQHTASESNKWEKGHEKELTKPVGQEDDSDAMIMNKILEEPFWLYPVWTIGLDLFTRVSRGENVKWKADKQWPDQSM